MVHCPRGDRMPFLAATVDQLARNTRYQSRFLRTGKGDGITGTDGYTSCRCYFWSRIKVSIHIYRCYAL